MTEITDLSPTDSSNTEVTGESLDGSIANMGRMDNTLQAILGMFGRWTSSDTIASAATTDIGAQAEAYLTVSGATTITSFGTVRAGTIRFLQFSGILTLTYNATSLILPGAASITTAAGDAAVFVSEGAGNWRCLLYNKANGQPISGGGISSNSPSNLSLVASVAGNALTIAVKGFDGSDPSASNPVYIPFRNATAANGDVDILTLTAAASFVVSSGSTLGTTSGVAATLYVGGFNDAGTFRLGLVNPDGQFFTNSVASSTAEGGAGAADSPKVWYTGTAVTTKAVTILGYIRSTQATAGTWATAPSLVHVSDAGETSTFSMPIKRVYTSPQQVLTSGGALTLAHGLGVIPTLVTTTLVCTVANAGYSIGDNLIVPPTDDNGTLIYGISIVPDATNLVCRYAGPSNGSATWVVPNKTTGTREQLNPVSWQLVIRAYAG